jgi:hypothetical protein
MDVRDVYLLNANYAAPGIAVEKNPESDGSSCAFARVGGADWVMSVGKDG